MNGWITQGVFVALRIVSVALPVSFTIVYTDLSIVASTLFVALVLGTIFWLKGRRRSERALLIMFPIPLILAVMLPLMSMGDDEFGRIVLLVLFLGLCVAVAYAATPVAGGNTDRLEIEAERQQEIEDDIYERAEYEVIFGQRTGSKKARRAERIVRAVAAKRESRFVTLWCERLHHPWRFNRMWWALVFWATKISNARVGDLFRELVCAWKGEGGYGEDFRDSTDCP